MSSTRSLRKSGARILAASLLACLTLIGAGPALALAPARDEAEALASRFRKAAEKVLPSVVAVRPVGVIGRPPMPPAVLPRLFPGPFLPGPPGVRGGLPELAGTTGSGLVVDSDRGLILTAERVVAGAPRVMVVFTDGREIEATRVVRDPQSELVLLFIEPGNARLKAAEWGESEKLGLGDWVLTAGRPSGQTHAISAGIVSGRGAGAGATPGFDDDAIRTDAVINPANLGGPLVDLDGKVLGIVNAAHDPTGRQWGIGFATPATRAQRIVADLADFGQVRRGYLGLMVAPEGDRLGEAPAGLLVNGVSPGGPSADAGIRLGDRIVALDGQPISSLEVLSRAVENAPVGREFKLTIERAGERKEITVKSRARPDAAGARPVPFGASPRSPRPRGRAGAPRGDASRSPGEPSEKAAREAEPPDSKPARAPQEETARPK